MILSVGMLGNRKILFTLVTIFLFAFIFFLYSLFRYSISYGIDGPYYDIQIRNILRTGFPNSNDPPFVYYYLLPFTIIFGSFAGIKIGMSLIGALTVFPTYYLVKDLIGSKSQYVDEIALVSSVLMVFNWFTLRMIEDFMQNYAGTIWLLLFMIAISRWFETNQRRYAYLTAVSLALAFLTHLYIASLIAVLLVSAIVARLIFNYRTGSKEDVMGQVKIMGVLILAVAVLVFLVALIIPSTLSTFSKVISFLSVLGQADSRSSSFLVFLSLPFVVGLYASIVEVKDEKESVSRFVGDVQLISISLVIFFLSLPILPSSWTSRFIMMAFVPITLLTAFSVVFVEVKISSAKRLIYGILAIFLIASIASALVFSNSMGPSITVQQYDALVHIKALIPGTIDPNGVMISSQQTLKYWVEYVLDMTVVSSAINTSKPLYRLVITSQVTSPFSPNNPTTPPIILPYSLNFLFPTQQTPGGGSPPSNQPPSGQPPGGQGSQPATGTLIYTDSYFAVYKV